jgi:hypothetical protein
MSQAERDDLRRLIAKREKFQKSAAAARSAELIVDFKNQMASEFAFDDDETWAQATREAEAEVAKAQAKIAARCRTLGIPERFAPQLNLRWVGRGYDNMVDRRKAELLGVAKAQVEAIERQAIVAIEQSSVEALTRITLAESEEARAFIASLPTVEQLMQPLSYAAIAGPADPPIAEQLVTPNALRQRRFRERQAALRATAEALPRPLHNGGPGADEGAP